MKYKTSIIQYPTGKFGFVGSVPEILTRENPKPNIASAERVSKIYEKKEEAQKDLDLYLLSIIKE
ncbi:MAG TPA: hypothetical protein VIJ25_18525 [Methylococcales bacterium]